VLDFAGGAGRNLAPLMARSDRVTLADRDSAALEAAPAAVERLCADLESGPWPFRGRRFDAVVCCNYLHRPRLDLLIALVAPGGLLLYETFAQGNERHGRPARPDFRCAAASSSRRRCAAGWRCLASRTVTWAAPGRR
jgi:2-polyprenyl-3-methyl-5-hydroxy-6-metoxy-1,4-benzoquinol methylase